MNDMSISSGWFCTAAPVDAGMVLAGPEAGVGHLSISPHIPGYSCSNPYRSSPYHQNLTATSITVGSAERGSLTPSVPHGCNHSKTSICRDVVSLSPSLPIDFMQYQTL